MADGKFFSEQTKDAIVKFGDELIKVNAFLEVVDGPSLRIVTNYIDKLGDKFIPDEYDQNINDAVTKVIEGDYDGACDDIAVIENKIIDLPYTDEDTELDIFKAGNAFLLALLKDFIAKKKAE